MIEALIYLFLGGCLLIAGVLAVRAHHQRVWRHELVAYVLRFPRGLDAAAVTAFVTGLSGLVAPRLHRPFVARAVMVETTASDSGIEHHLLMPPSLAPMVLSALRAALPGVSVRLDETYQAIRPVVAAELGLSNQRRMLALDRAEAVSAALLASLHPLAAGQQVVVQWSLSPVGPLPAVPTIRRYGGFGTGASVERLRYPAAERGRPPDRADQTVGAAVLGYRSGRHRSPQPGRSAVVAREGAGSLPRRQRPWRPPLPPTPAGRAGPAGRGRAPSATGQYAGRPQRGRAGRGPGLPAR
jgi:hypothetical protein